MQKRIITAYSLSAILPVLAIVILCMRVFAPASRYVAMGIYAAGWIALILAIRNHRRSQVMIDRKGRRFRRVLQERPALAIAVALLAAFAYLAWVAFPVQSSAFLTADTEAIEELIDSDIARLPVFTRGLSSVLSGNYRLFRADINEMSLEDKDNLRHAWASYLDYAIQLDRLRTTHQYFYQINPVRTRELHIRSFLIGYGAFVANYENAWRISIAVGENPFLETFLNEADTERSVPRDAFLMLKRGLTHPDNVVRLNAGQAYLKILESTTSGLQTNHVVIDARKRYSFIAKKIGEAPETLIDAPLDQFEDLTFKAWFPLQKSVALGLSMVRMVHRENLVSLADIEKLAPRLEPGDMMLERRNWYLSNVGLPGFWPHVALYTGGLEEMDAYFGELVPALTGKDSIAAYLSETNPTVLKAYQATGPGQFNMRVIEALKGGIVLTPLEISARADYLAILRPKLPKRDKLKALLNAFEFYGVPYDYNFDFATDNRLVCSELVYKSYLPRKFQKGIQFNIGTVSGRLVLPPNDIAREFDEEFGSPAADLEFVAFLDGNEAAQKAIEQGVDAFRVSWRRPKWDIAQH